MEKATNVSSKAKWTVMVYMAGDNNLDGAALRDIAEMAKVGSTKDVNVLVQLDRIEDKLTRRFRITKGGGFKKDCVESFGDTNTGDLQILYDFVRWAADNYPADRHYLILWNHGSGWWEEDKGRAAGPAGQKRRNLFRHALPQAHRSICYDDTSGGDALDNRELKLVLTGICTLLGKKIDILGMDACLMNMVEVAYQLRNSVNYIVGSEIEEPFDGWPYTEILTYLTTKPAKDTATFAREIVKPYVGSYQGKNETVPVPKNGIRRHREEAGPPPIRLRRLALAGSAGTDDEDLDLSAIIIELPMSELASLLSQHLAIRLYNLVRGLFEIPHETSFPYCLDEIVRNKNLLSALRARLAHINNLTELITDPPAILIDERHQLFFYRSIPVMLRPISFSYLLLLAKTPAEFVMREDIYNHLWPGQINYEGTNKPYERQISDHKRKLIAEIREGITGKVEMMEGEMETFIST